MKARYFISSLLCFFLIKHQQKIKNDDTYREKTHKSTLQREIPLFKNYQLGKSLNQY
jgi:hypothetical protein